MSRDIKKCLCLYVILLWCDLSSFHRDYERSSLTDLGTPSYGKGRITRPLVVAEQGIRMGNYYGIWC